MKGCRQRCVFLTHDQAVTALDRCIERHWATDAGTEFDRKRFRGLSPETALIVKHRGSGFELTTKRRKLAGGEVEPCLACDALQAHVTALYQAAGLRGCISSADRRRFAARLVEQGHGIEIVQSLLGHAKLDHTDSCVQPSHSAPEQMFSTALQWCT